jgi:hypothetical protein
MTQHYEEKEFEEFKELQEFRMCRCTARSIFGMFSLVTGKGKATASEWFQRAFEGVISHS